MAYLKRKSPRLPGYDYSTPNYYFITICTYEKKCIFGKPEKLGPYGEFAWEYLKKIPEYYPGIQVDVAVVMPNHIHAILIVEGGSEEIKRNDLIQAVGKYKMAVTKAIRAREPDKMVWQRSFHDHVIRNQAAYEKIWEYVKYNPQKWGEDTFYVNLEP